MTFSLLIAYLYVSWDNELKSLQAFFYPVIYGFMIDNDKGIGVSSFYSSIIS